MRLAIIGLDSIYWPRAFADALKSLGSAIELVGVCDLGCPDATVKSQIGVSGSELAEAYNTRLFHTVQEAAAEAQACLVCTRNTRMPAVIEELLLAGIPVFAAKPVSCSAEGIRRVLSAQRRSGLACAAGQGARSAPALRAACRLIAEGEVGDVLSVRMSHQHGRLADWPLDWWYRDPAEGDPFLWMGWYCIDGVTALTGSLIASIAGAGQRHLERHGDMPDLIRGIAKLEDGRIVTLEIHLTVGAWDVATFEIEVVGSAGVLRVAGPGQKLVVLDDAGAREVPFDAADDQLAFELGAWLRSVKGQGRPVVSLDEAAHLVLASLAWRKAAREEKWVDVEKA